MAARNVVIAPLVIVKNEDGSDRYLYQGAVLPEHVKGDDLKRLKDEGLVGTEKDAAAAEEAADPTAPDTGAAAAKKAAESSDKK